MGSKGVSDVLALEVPQARVPAAAEELAGVGSPDGTGEPNVGRGENRGRVALEVGHSRCAANCEEIFGFSQAARHFGATLANIRSESRQGDGCLRFSCF